MRYGVGNFVVLVVPLALWLVADYFFVRGGQDPASPFLNDILGVLVLGSVPVGLGYVNWPICRRDSLLATVGLTLVLVVAVSVAWFFVAFTILMNFHIWLGGTH